MTHGPYTTKRIIASPDAVARLTIARDWLTRQAKNDTLVVVGATWEAAADVVREVSLELGSSFGWRSFSLVQLERELSRRARSEEGLVAIGTVVVQAVCTRIVHLAEASGRLGRFAPIADRPGLPRAIARTLLELRLERQSPDDLADTDLAGLYREYESELVRARQIDHAGLVESALGVVERGHPLVGVSLLVLDVPLSGALESQLVRALWLRARQALLVYPEGDERTRRHVDSFGTPIELVRPTVGSALARLKAGLFGEIGTPSVRAEDVGVFSAPGESRECVEIARLVQREAECGTPFDRIAVLLRAPTQYRSHLEEAFRRAAIPSFFARGVMRPDPEGRAFLALLACAAEGLSATRFAEFLSLGQVPSATQDGAPPEATLGADRHPETLDELLGAGRSSREEDSDVDSDVVEEGPVVGGTLRAPRLWEKMLVDEKVIGGLDRWRRRLDGLSARLALEERETKDPEDAAAQQRRRESQALQGLRDYALPLLEDLAALPVSAPWRNWLDCLSALATRALRDPRRVLGVLAELEPMADVGPVELAEVRIVLDERLGDVIRRPPPGRYGRVFVGTTDEARGRAFDVVFVPGLAEKLFPEKVSEDPILPDSFRLKTGLITNADRSNAERLALRIAIGAARRRVVVSYPRLDLEQSRPRTPSFYGLEVLRAAEGELPGFDELARRSISTGAPKVGWPAPADPRDAIDHAEHDLALLEGVLKLGETESVGMAHYLLSANPHLARALRARGRRWVKAWKGPDGMVEPADEAMEAMRQHRLSARSYSPTGLQHYASCPYRFFLQAVHRLAPREKPAPLEDLDPLERGSLVHEALFELHIALREEALLPVTPQNLETARAHLDRILERVAGRYKDELAPAIERVWDDAVAGIRADLREWLRRASLDVTWKPVYFELSFGLSRETGRAERDPNSRALPVPLDSGIQLRGSIDLVEESVAGPLRAIDYKTGKVRVEPGKEPVIGGGTMLQPVLYALALEKLLPGRRVLEGRLYYCTAVGGFKPVPVQLDERAREGADLVAKTIGGAIERGFLPAAPAEGACKYCDYRVVCGPYEEERIKRKRADELAPLEALRRTP
jgi:ATP-dependent helicase/nuclease subunit B